MKPLLLSVYLFSLAFCGRAEIPTLKAVQAAVQTEDFERTKEWVNQNGVDSSTAVNALIASAMEGKRGMVDKLLALGIPVNATNELGVTPLLKAADEGITEMVRHLLQCGARPNMVGWCSNPDCKGHTALIGAVCKQDLEMATMLLDAGADPRLANDSAINTADQNGDVPIFLLLQQYGAREKSSGPDKATERRLETIIPLANLGLTGLLPGSVTSETASAEKTKVRLSVIADDNNLILADLLTARLSGEPSLEMVERQEFDRVLAEQKLTRQFAVDAANYGKVALLLRADALLLIKTSQIGGNKVVESRLIRVNPGLALDTIYSSEPIESAPKWAERMGDRVMRLVSKVTQKNAIALSLLNIRASITSSEDRRLDRSIVTMLSDRFTHEPQFVLLERAAIERAAFEHTGQFWTGSYLVDGTIEPALDGRGVFTLSVRFQPTGRGEPLVFAATGTRTNPAKVIDELLAEINSRLTRAPAPQKRDPSDEAQRYLEEARWALAADQLAAAQSASEAAWALGSHSTEVAQLRVLTAMFLVRQLCHQPGGKDELLGPAAWLELSIHALTVWRDTLASELIQGHPKELRKWLELGLEMSDIAALTLIKIPSASERVRQANRIETLQELTWESLQEIWTRSAELPDTMIGNTVSEKQAAFARLLISRSSRLIQSVNDVFARNFAKDNSRTRAHVRSNLVKYWNLSMVMAKTSRLSGQGANVRLPRVDEVSRQLGSTLGRSAAPEDRYVSALLSISTASLRHEAAAADLDRLLASLFDMDKLLAEGGDVFGSYWERFEALDKLNGVPFFAINRTYSDDGHRMWDRHTPEHTEFRRKLFLRLATVAVAKVPASDFGRLISLDQYTPEQTAEVTSAQARLGDSRRGSRPGPGAALAAKAQTGAGVQSRAGAASAPETNRMSSSESGFKVSRLWTPFNLGLEIVPEFEAEFGSMVWADGRIWLHGSTVDRGGQPDKHYIFAIEPDSLRTEILQVPEPSTTLNARIAVTPSSVLFVDKNFLAIRDRLSGRWDTYKEIHAAGLHPLILVGDSVYLIVAEPPGNALIDFDLKQRAARILASTRRRPAASPFDDPGLEIKSVATNETGEIVVKAETFAPNVPAIECVSHAWSPATQAWREVHPRMLKSAAPRTPPQSPMYNRVGTVGKKGGHVVLHLSREGKVATDIPLDFLRQAGLRLPDSRYGGQNVRPDSACLFPGGLVLRPNSGSGFWIILQRELDDHLEKSKSRASTELRQNLQN